MKMWQNIIQVVLLLQTQKKKVFKLFLPHKIKHETGHEDAKKTRKNLTQLLQNSQSNEFVPEVVALLLIFCKIKWEKNKIKWQNRKFYFEMCMEINLNLIDENKQLH